MDIRQLNYFVTAVEEKTITAAAAKLHMTQPPLTMQLHALEDELGCKLFQRDGRNLRLTDAGQQMYIRAAEILTMCDNAKHEMSNYKKGTAGTLRIGVISSVQGTLFTDWLKLYHDKYPNVKISICSGNTYRLLERLQNREIDMAIIRTPFSAAKLDVEYIKREEILAVGDKSYFKNINGSQTDLEELSKIPLIIYRRWKKIIEAAFEGAGLSPDIYCVNDDARMTLLLALKGLGVSLLHPSALPENLNSSIAKLKLPEKSLISDIALVCRDKKQLPEPAVLFWNTANSG